MTPAEASDFLDAQPVGTIVEVEGRFKSGGGWGDRFHIKQPGGRWHDSSRHPSPGLPGKSSRSLAMAHQPNVAETFVRVLARSEVYDS